MHGHDMKTHRVLFKHEHEPVYNSLYQIHEILKWLKNDCNKHLNSIIILIKLSKYEYTWIKQNQIIQTKWLNNY